MMVVQSCPLNSNASSTPSKCIDRIRSGLSGPAFGFKVQALAAHVLLRLDYQILGVNSSGHPDIVAYRDGTEFRFEVEAEVSGRHLRKLTDADLDSLTDMPGVIGYYALAISVPAPKWVLVSAQKLARRARSSPRSLLEALSDKLLSEAWTDEYTRLICNEWRWIKLASYAALCERALAGHSL